MEDNTRYTGTSSGNYHSFTQEGVTEGVYVAIRAYEKLSNVTLCAAEAGETELYRLDNMDDTKPFVALLTFPGDTSGYTLQVTDSDGNIFTYTISISGRNGSLVMY